MLSRGFGAPFLDPFAPVSAHNNSACGAALVNRTHIRVEDVTTNYLFVGTRALDVMLAAGAGGTLDPGREPERAPNGCAVDAIAVPGAGDALRPRFDCLALHLADRLEEPKVPHE